MNLSNERIDFIIKAFDDERGAPFVAFWKNIQLNAMGFLCLHMKPDYYLVNTSDGIEWRGAFDIPVCTSCVVTYKQEDEIDVRPIRKNIDGFTPAPGQLLSLREH